MSSGLTYISVFDFASGAPDTTTSPVVFSNYDEAYAYASWFVRLANEFIGNNQRVTIWTSGPNSNGYFLMTDGEPVFYSFE